MEEYKGPRYIKGEHSHLKNNFLPEESVELLKELEKKVPWQKIKWGRGYLPRLVYRVDNFWPEPIQELKERTEETFQCTVRSAWCNLYQSGNDYTPPHQDNYGAHVITWSFGGSRRFICENIKSKKKEEYLLEDGDVFYFSPKFDSKHLHSIPKTKKNVDLRISIVFFTDVPYCRSNWILKEVSEEFFFFDENGILRNSKGEEILSVNFVYE